MVRDAVDMMLEPTVEVSSAPMTNWLLQQISYLDDAGAWEWNLRWTSLVWLLTFAAMRLTLAERGGINWYALLHAIIAGLGGVVCAYLSFVSAEYMTGTPEPLGTALCHGPLTSLHRILPTVSVGYSVFDLLDGLHLGADFLSHGAVMFLFSAYIMEVDKNQVLAVMLTLEVSTIFLDLIRAKFFTPRMAMANMLLFVITFFLCRIVFGPYAIYQHASVLYSVGREQSQHCLPRGFDHIILVTGIFFNVLNFFWFYKILRKLKRKLTGTEGIKDTNRLGNSVDGVKVFKKIQKEQD